MNLKKKDGRSERAKKRLRPRRQRRVDIRHGSLEPRALRVTLHKRGIECRVELRVVASKVMTIAHPILVRPSHVGRDALGVRTAPAQTLLLAHVSKRSTGPVASRATGAIAYKVHSRGVCGGGRGCHDFDLAPYTHASFSIHFNISFRRGLFFVLHFRLTLLYQPIG